MSRLELALRPAFARVRALAERSLLSEQGGRFELCSEAWLEVSEVHLKRGHGGKHRLWEVVSKTPSGNPESRNGIIMNGRFPTNRGTAGDGFPRFLDSWEEDGSADLAESLIRVIQGVRKAGLTKKGLMDAWNESLIIEVMES